MIFFFSSRRRHTRCALVTGVQTCALPILKLTGEDVRLRIAGRALRVLEVVLGISDANQMRRIERIAAEARIDGRIDHILSRCGSGDRRKRQQQKCSPRQRHASTPTEIRSEEHTSELQSLMRISYAVLCLKKKTK